MSGSAHADVSSIGLQYQAGELQFEVHSAEVTPENEAEVIESLAADIAEARRTNPASHLETGWYHPANPGEGLSQSGNTDRSPAQVARIFSRAQGLIQKLKTRLDGAFIQTDHSFGLVDPKLDASNSRYLKYSNAIYTTIRISHSYIGRVATFVIAGYGLQSSIELGMGVALGCGLIAANYDHVLRFVKYGRAYSLIRPGASKWLDRVRNDPVRAAKLDRLHGKANWGFFEAIFTVAVLGLETGIGKALGLPVPFPTLPEATFSFLAAFNSQQVWDRAVMKYEDLLNLQPNLSEDFKRAALRKRAAIGSVVSVVSMTASSMPYLPVKVAGFAMLLGLRQAGAYYEKRIEARIAKQIASVKPCDLLTTK
ncbi:MAG: hypothetical protein EBX52_02690 [Proteobacteria bacterium]|nr:hypothetical protein [Pseudomonadota bacterium]